MKVVVAVDSFKGSMTSMEAGMAVKEGILAAKKDAEVVVKPLADGGEGTTDALIDYLGKNKNKGLDAKLALATKWVGGVFIVLTLVLNLF